MSSMKMPSREAAASHTGDSPKAYWLLVERYENWLVDRDCGFKQFGIPRLKEKLGRQIRSGDLLISYVSSAISSFADIREAQEDGLSKLGVAGKYYDVFPWRVKTKPVFTLPPDQWVPIKSLISQLSFTSTRTDWRQAMRQSLRKLQLHDATLIVDAMHRADKKISMSPISSGGR